MEIPSWGNVVWFDQDVDEDDDDDPQWTTLPFKTGPTNDQEIDDDEGQMECHTKIEHQSASKQYYEKFATNRIYKFEEEFQASTKHDSSTPIIEYDTFKPLDDEDMISKDNKPVDRVEDTNDSNEDELGNIFNLNVSGNKKTTIKGQRNKDLYFNLKNLQ